MKLDPTGAVVWQRHYDGNGGCNNVACYGGSDARSVRPTADGGYVLAGLANFELIDPQAPASESWLAKTDSGGTLVWQNNFYAVNRNTGLPFPSAFSGLGQTTDGGLVAVGYSDEYNSSDNIWSVRTDTNGAIANCREVHPSLLQTLTAALTTSNLSVPVTSVSAARTTASATRAPGGLVTRRDC